MRVSHYSVIQYVPDPIADERMNLGVLAFDDERIHVRFLKNWQRVYWFGPDNIDFLKNFAVQMESTIETRQSISSEEVSIDSSNYEQLLSLSKEWQNILQITPPRKSFGDARTVLDQMSKIFLKESFSEKTHQD